MAACSPIKLGLVLNFSVFYFEICKDSKTACNMADAALTQALERIDDLGEEEFKEAKAIIELLRENLSIWQEEIPSAYQSKFNDDAHHAAGADN